MQTKITVRRPDGTTEVIAKAGVHITDQGMRRKIEQATRQAGRGEIIGWELVGKAPKTGTNWIGRMHAQAHAEDMQEQGRCPVCGCYQCGEH